MPGLPSLGVAEFAAFFEAVHGHEPFPWQTRLARAVAHDGWPGVLDIPTGCGKTAVLDVAVFLLAMQAELSPRPSARRIIFVVDRRTIVDQAFERAKVIRDALSDSTHEVVVRVRARLASLSLDGRPLDVALLRGGIARDDGWARTPDQPLIAVSTVDQVGSRLLFRGYGVSDGMKPVHAGLLGHDVLYLLDEVHLSQPFRETLAAIAGRYRTWASRVVPGPFAVVEMSATPGTLESAPPFRLHDDDRAHPVLSRRLTAAKPALLRSVNARGFHPEVQRQVLRLLDRPGATVAVVVNRVRSAREIHHQLSEAVLERGGTAYLLTGRMRPFDRDQLEQGILARIRAGRIRSPEDHPVVVVATQSIEAGADFDFDGLITECASLDALRQRFGRLDRLGDLNGSARGVIVAREDTLKDDAVYGAAIGKAWAWLNQAATDDVVDFGIEAMHLPVTAQDDGLLAPRPHAPILLPSHLDAWVQTSPMPDPDPDVALWLHGPERGTADVQVIWRADLTESALRVAASESDPRAGEAEEVVLGIVDALRPGAAEAMAVPFLAARRWMLGETESDVADVEGVLVEKEDGRRQTSGGRPAVLWRGDDSCVILPADLRPGHTIIVPSSYGGVADANWSPESTDPVVDIGERAVGLQRRQFALRLHPRVVRDIASAEVVPPLPGPVEPGSPDDRDVVVGWLRGITETEPATPLQELVATMPSIARGVKVERARSWAGEDEPAEYFVVRWPMFARPSAVRDAAPTLETEDGTTASFSGVDVTLADHSEGVAATVATLADHAGLPDDLREDLCLAAGWHDAGKADPRFQQWLHGGSEFKVLAQQEPLAKSRLSLGRAARRAARVRARYPKGGRHEVMSIALMDSAGEALASRAHDHSLVWHLVATHHGRCRALVPWVPDSTAVEVAFDDKGVACQASSRHELARLDSGVAERFWEVIRTYGWWGAAWLETVFRLADHRQSEREQQEHGGRRR